MNYDGLTQAYWDEQRRRFASLCDRASASALTDHGRVIPEDDDLAIGVGRRLRLAVMFIDISGFSSRPSETAAEQRTMLLVLNLFFAQILAIAEDYGGVVEKNTGDGLMAYFEDAGSQESPGATQRAVASALTMMSANEYLIGPALAMARIPPLAFRASIDHGWATIARLGAPRRFNANAAIGATANFAAKMLSKAAPGEIVLGATAQELLPDAWKQFTELAAAGSGWTYRVSGLPYPLYRYTGRWSRVVAP